MKKILKNIIMRLLYPKAYSSEAFILNLKSKGAEIGDNTYIYQPYKCRIDVENAKYIKIGENCIITGGVIILAHDYSWTVLANRYHEILRAQKETIIGNNVFVGMNSIILMGAEIGNNVIIGAGSVVSGKVESDSVYAGNPARKICTLEEHRNKRRNSLSDSIELYASKCKSVEEMGVYRFLFESKEAYIDFLKTQSLHGIDKRTIENIEIDSEFVYNIRKEDFIHFDSSK